MMVAAVFYGLSTFEGSFMAIRPVNALSHYTDWTVGHVHSGAMGWVALISFGSIYALTPVLWRRETMYSWKAGRVALLVGPVGDRHLRLRDVEQRHHPGADVADLHRERDAANTPSSTRSWRCTPTTSRALSAACCSCIGAIIGFWNVVMTIRHVPRAEPALDYPTSSEASEPAVPARSSPMPHWFHTLLTPFAQVLRVARRDPLPGGAALHGA